MYFLKRIVRGDGESLLLQIFQPLIDNQFGNPNFRNIIYPNFAKGFRKIIAKRADEYTYIYVVIGELKLSGFKSFQCFRKCCQGHQDGNRNESCSCDSFAYKQAANCRKAF